MPTVKTTTRDIYVNGNAAGPSNMKEDISDVIDAIDPREIPLLSVLGFSNEASASGGADSLRFPCIQPQHSWLNDELIPSASAYVSGSISSGTGTLTITTGEGAYFSAGDIVAIVTSNDGASYIYEVDSTGTSTIVLTEAGGETAQADPTLVAGDPVYILGNAMGEGTITTTSLTFASTVTTQTTNFTQIFGALVQVAGSWQSTEQYGITNPFDREVDKKIKETVIKLERAAHYGSRSISFPTADVTTGTTAGRRMGGLYYYLRDGTGGSGANTKDMADAALTESALLDLLQDIWTDGGKPDTVWVGARQKRALNNFIVPFVQTSRTEGTAGVIVGRYESDFGDVNVVLDRYVAPTDLIITSNEYLGIGPLKGNGQSRAFAIEKLPRRGDLDEAQIIGEYTMEVRNNTRAHGWMYELANS